MGGSLLDEVEVEEEIRAAWDWRNRSPTLLGLAESPGARFIVPLREKKHESNPGAQAETYATTCRLGLGRGRGVPGLGCIGVRSGVRFGVF